MKRTYTPRNSTTIDWEYASKLYNDGLSYMEIVKVLNVPSSVFTRKAPKFLKVRGKSQAQTNARNRGKGLKQHTDETIKLIRKKALISPHRRLKKKTINYKNIILDSSWELKLAKLLDSLQIEWVRPGPIRYNTESGTHHYFPDFYLPKYDLYLDPKNKFAKLVQKEKLETILTQYRNIIIMDLSDINEKFLTSFAPVV